MLADFFFSSNGIEEPMEMVSCVSHVSSYVACKNTNILRHILQLHLFFPNVFEFVVVVPPLFPKENRALACLLLFACMQKTW